MKDKRKVNEFYVGILIIAIISILFVNKAILYTGAFENLSIFKFNIYSVLIVLPAFLGGIMFFYNRKSIIPKILSILGIVLLIFAIISLTILSFGKFTILQYILFIIFEIIGIVLVVISFINKEKKYVK